MPPREPSWWYGQPRPLVERALSPFASAWGTIAERRFRNHTPYISTCPVICVGNLTAGGTGKTPTALFLAEMLVSLGRTPVFLTRGYGGRIAGPHWVDVERDLATDVGDEPLLLARRAPTMVCSDRAAGARAIEARGQALDVVVMDDGLQNPSLAKSLTLCVVDARRGIGNGRVLPAGPLRAPLDFQLALADAVLVNGVDGSATADAGTADIHTLLRRKFDGPVLRARTAASAAPTWLREDPLVAYCGIGAPQRFLDLVHALGGHVVATEVLPDHHAFSDADAVRLLDLAHRHGARLVTTEKDLVRLAGHSDHRGRLAASSTALAIALSMEPGDAERMISLLRGAMARAQRTTPR